MIRKGKGVFWSCSHPQGRDPGLRDLAVLRLAGLKAAEGNLKEAIELARRVDARGELAWPRAKLIETWQQMLKERGEPAE